MERSDSDRKRAILGHFDSDSSERPTARTLTTLKRASPGFP